MILYTSIPEPKVEVQYRTVLYSIQYDIPGTKVFSQEATLAS